MGYCPIPGLGRDRVSRHGFPCRDMVLRSSARPGLSACDRHARAAWMHTRQSFLVLCRDRDIRVATLFPSELGGLGRDRGFLCRDRDRSALCRDRNYVSQQGFGLSRAWVATELGHGRRPCVHDKGMGATEEFCQDRDFYVATEFHLEERIGVAT